MIIYLNLSLTQLIIKTKDIKLEAASVDRVNNNVD